MHRRLIRIRRWYKEEDLDIGWDNDQVGTDDILGIGRMDSVIDNAQL